MELTEEDTIVIPGDVGANFHSGRRDNLVKSVLADLAEATGERRYSTFIRVLRIQKQRRAGDYSPASSL